MEENEKKPGTEPGTEPGDEKLHVTKSVFQSTKEMQEKADEEARIRHEEIQRKYRERRKKAEEARDKRLEEERLELLRLKTGVIEESETIHEEEPEQLKRTFFQKIGDFFYSNKWWLGICCVLACIGGFLLYDHFATPRPDMIVLLIGKNAALGEESQLKEYLSEFTADNTNNGKKLVSVYYIPYSGVEKDDFINSVPQQLSTELQNADSVIVITNDIISGAVTPENTFVDLTGLYPGNEHVSGYKFLLAGTDFAEKVGVPESAVADGWFIALREPCDLLYSKKKNMQETYDKDFAAFDAIVKDLSE